MVNNTYPYWFTTFPRSHVSNLMDNTLTEGALKVIYHCIIFHLLVDVGPLNHAHPLPTGEL